MGFMLVWANTVFISLVMELANESKIYKDIADRGYRVNIKKASYLGDEFEQNRSEKILYTHLVPIVNLYYAIKHRFTYNNNKELFLDKLKESGVLEKMYDSEKEQYAANPSGANAIRISRAADYRIEEKIMIGNDSEKSEVIFELNCDGKINILNVRGTASRLPKEDLISEVEETWNKNWIESLKEEAAYINKENLLAKKEELLNMKKEAQEQRNLFNEDNKQNTNTNKVLKKK